MDTMDIAREKRQRFATTLLKPLLPKRPSVLSCQFLGKSVRRSRLSCPRLCVKSPLRTDATSSLTPHRRLRTLNNAQQILEHQNVNSQRSSCQSRSVLVLLLISQSLSIMPSLQPHTSPPLPLSTMPLLLLLLPSTLQL